jgi:hypothetical protein
MVMTSSSWVGLILPMRSVARISSVCGAPVAGPWPCEMAAASTVTLRQPAPSGGLADAASGAYGSKPKGVYTSSALLQPNQLQDLVDVLDDIVKAAVGVALRFQLQISLGDGEDISSEKLREVNQLLESVSPELRVQK